MLLAFFLTASNLSRTASGSSLFCKVFSDKELCKEFLETMLHIEIDHLEEVRAESYQSADPNSKTVRFDVFAKENGRMFDIEMQMTDNPNLPLRARYYQSMCDIDTLESSDNYMLLKESFVIFICPFDLFGEGLPLYTFENLCLEKNSVYLGDKTQKLFYNFKKYDKMKDEGERAMLEYFDKGKPTDSLTNKIDDSLNRARGNESWRREHVIYNVTMQTAYEKGRAEMQPIIDQQAAEIAEKDRRIAELEAQLAKQNA